MFDYSNYQWEIDLMIFDFITDHHLLVLPKGEYNNLLRELRSSKSCRQLHHLSAECSSASQCPRACTQTETSGRIHDVSLVDHLHTRSKPSRRRMT